ncbi:MAG TPA: YdjY domain-containing protein [Planctomycetota bacterium]|nr:YdjY domain-containing protein [Planctomycetota bacterium]
MPRLLLVAALALVAHSWTPAGEGQKPELPGLRLDLKAKTIEVDGAFCVGPYPLELLACQGTMKDYESMISSPCKPSVLHTALLALGLKPRVRDDKEPGRVLREGDPVDIFLRFTREGKEVTVEPRDLIVHIESKKHIPGTPFVFFGSFLFPDPEDKTRMIYLGDAESWLIGLLGDTASVIDLPPDAAGKYGALAIDAKAAPAKGSKVTLIIRPAAGRKPPGHAKEQ